MIRHHLAAAVALATTLVLDWGAASVAHANACWSAGFDDPATVDVSDLSGLAVETGVLHDPMDDVRRALLVVLGPTGLVAPATAATPDETVLSAHLPRAPPAV